jgi:hypothetical protein
MCKCGVTHNKMIIKNCRLIKETLAHLSQQFSIKKKNRKILNRKPNLDEIKTPHLTLPSLSEIFDLIIYYWCIPNKWQHLV